MPSAASRKKPIRNAITSEARKASMVQASGQPLMALTGGKKEHLVWTRGTPSIFKSSNRVERAFCKLRQHRAVATRYDKRDFVWRGAVDVASIRIWLRHPVSSRLIRASVASIPPYMGLGGR